MPSKRFVHPLERRGLHANKYKVRMSTFFSKKRCSEALVAIGVFALSRMFGKHVSQAGPKVVTNTIRATQSVTLGSCQFSDRIAVLKQDRKLEPDPKVLRILCA